jgi:DNA helicase-2/ATP-dependent DNA helicase PcrA
MNPSDTISWRRALKLLDNVGDVTAEQIVDYLGVDKTEFPTSKAKTSLFKRLKQFPARPGYKDQLLRLAHLLGTLREKKGPAAQVTAIARFYQPILRASFDDHPRRQREVDHLINIAKRYRTADELLADVALDPVDLAQADAGARGKGYVTLSTVHSAKGLEWNTLFVIWMMDGWFPSLRASDVFEDLEEEKRLLYVAATRAKQNLYFTCPMNTHGSYESNFYSGVSRFLEPLSPSTLVRASLSGDGEG